MVKSLKQNNKRADFKRWFNVDQGSSLYEYERDYVATVLPDLFGYHIVQLGSLNDENYLHSSRIGHKVVCQLADEGELGEPGEQVQLVGTGELLPFPVDSIDVVVAPHVLEFTHKPHKLLREIESVLIGEGHTLLIGFNPWSLWGLWRFFLAWRDKAPWHGHFYSISRLKDWLCLLDFEIVHVEKFIFRPPLQRPALMRKLLFLEKLGKYCWPYFGSVYMILAKKRVTPMTPVKMRWQRQRQRIAASVVEPTARSTPRSMTDKP